tara:strand:- start:3834 stop:4985 length:1152 start_codon:yes stop_codon:yes gene_type:complete
MDNDTFIEIDPPDFYLTDAISENAVSMITKASSGDNPFFLHVAYTAPHWPLHAIEEDIAKYRGNYRDGWDSLRKNRHEEQRGMGIVDDKWDISPRDASSRPWKEAEDKEWEDLRMAVYAAMIDRMDQGIGKILTKLKELGEDKDTVIMFLSDNGGCAEFLAEDTNRPDPSQYSSSTSDGRSMTVGNRKDIEPGPDTTFMSYDLAWANASNTPFRRFKRWTHEGGISTPFILNWPEKISRPSIITEATHIIDIAATIYDAANAQYPSELNGNATKPLEGHSFMQAIETGSWERKEPIYWEHEGSKAMRYGEWKLVSEVGHNWEFYNMLEDRTELSNLVDGESDRVRGMLNSYKKWMERCEVQNWPLPGHLWNPEMISSYAHRSG